MTEEQIAQTFPFTTFRGETQRQLVEATAALIKECEKAARINELKTLPFRDLKLKKNKTINDRIAWVEKYL